MSPNTVSPSPPSSACQAAAREVFQAFRSCLKALGLYPPKHPTCRKQLDLAHRAVSGFLDRYGPLHVAVGDKGLLLDDEPVYRDGNDPYQFARRLYADGVLWLEFEPGFTAHETEIFLQVLALYGTGSRDDKEHDLVSVLWTTALPHLDYEAVHAVWDGTVLTAPTDFKVLPGEEPGSGQPNGESGPASTPGKSAEEEKEGEGMPPAGAILVHNLPLFEINEEEQLYVQQLVYEEESGITAPDVLEVLLIILEDQATPEDFRVLLEFIREEVDSALGQGSLPVLTKLLKALAEMSARLEPSHPWAHLMIEDFFREFPSKSQTEGLARLLPFLDLPDSQELEEFRLFLLQLSPSATAALARLLEHAASPRLEEPLLETIGSLAQRNPRPLLRVIRSVTPELQKKLLFVVRNMKSRHGNKLLLQFLKSGDLTVRLEALTFILPRHLLEAKELFALLDAPAPAIRNAVLKYLHTTRREDTEAYIRQHLAKLQEGGPAPDNLLEYYRILGNCGSDRSLPFLQQTLEKGSWRSLVDRDRAHHRQGAALALALIDTPATEQVLLRAATSLVPAIRKAYLSALEETL